MKDYIKKMGLCESAPLKGNQNRTTAAPILPKLN
jgi:hypothetical protein